MRLGFVRQTSRVRRLKWRSPGEANDRAERRGKSDNPRLNILVAQQPGNSHHGGRSGRVDSNDLIEIEYQHVRFVLSQKSLHCFAQFVRRAEKYKTSQIYDLDGASMLGKEKHFGFRPDQRRSAGIET